MCLGALLKFKRLSRGRTSVSGNLRRMDRRKALRHQLELDATRFVGNIEGAISVAYIGSCVEVLRAVWLPNHFVDNLRRKM